MIEKTENPLNLSLDVINEMLPELQQKFDDYEVHPDMEALGLPEESGLCIEFKTGDGEVFYSYSLEQLKKLKVELEDPIFNSLKEMS